MRPAVQPGHRRTRCQLRQSHMEMRQARLAGLSPKCGATMEICLKDDTSCRKPTRPTRGGVISAHESPSRLPFGGSLESPALLRKCKYAFLTLPNYSLIAVANALEPLRMANRLVGKEIYQWSVVSMDGHAAHASSGLNLSPTGALDKLGPVDILFVCGGINVRDAVSPALLTALRRLADRRVPLGAFCTGGYAVRG